MDFIKKIDIEKFLNKKKTDMEEDVAQYRVWQKFLHHISTHFYQT